jgi:hypothetical protein
VFSRSRIALEERRDIEIVIASMWSEHRETLIVAGLLALGALAIYIFIL